jgi:hypothetical protein
VPAGAEGDRHRCGHLHHRAHRLRRARPAPDPRRSRRPGPHGGRLVERVLAVRLRGLLLVRLCRAGGGDRRAAPVRRRAGDDARLLPLARGTARGPAPRRDGVRVRRHGRAGAAGADGAAAARHRAHDPGGRLLGRLFDPRQGRGRSGGGHYGQLRARRADGPPAQRRLLVRDVARMRWASGTRSSRAA